MIKVVLFHRPAISEPDLAFVSKEETFMCLSVLWVRIEPMAVASRVFARDHAHTLVFSYRLHATLRRATVETRAVVAAFRSTITRGSWTSASPGCICAH